MSKFKNFLRKYHYSSGEGYRIVSALFIHSMVYRFTNALYNFTNRRTGKYIEYHNNLKKILPGDFQVQNISNKEIVFKRGNTTLTCRKFSSDLNVFYQIFTCDYFGNLVKFINEKGLNINTILDVGANAGYASVYFHSYFNAAKIITVEPDPGNFALLEKNMKNNAVNATNINCGIYKSRTNLYFDRSMGADKHWGVKLTEEPVSTDFIKTMSIDDIVSENKIEEIDLLKMSIEGAESLVFNEEGINLNFIRISKIIAIKIHDETIVKNRIIKILSEYNFQFFQSGEFFVAHKR